METYSYKAIASDGKERKGSVKADSKEEAVKLLKADGMTPLSITAQSLLDKDLDFSFGRKKSKVKSRDLSVFCRQFNSILRAGVSVISALDMLSDQTENKAMKQALKSVQSSVEKGETLSDAMRSEPDIFPSLLINMISAGEASGSLEASVERMAIQFEKDAKIKGMVKKAMTYPIILLFVAVGVVILMMAFVIPNFVGMFEDMGEELPAFTQAVLNMSNFITGRWYILVLVLIAIIFAYRTYAKTDKGRHTIARLSLKAPVFGSLIAKTASARFSRTFSTLLGAGMPMIEALDIAAKTMDNILYREALINVENGVGLGMELSAQLRMTGLFPAMVVHMTGIGEQTGNLEEMLTNVANYYDEEVEATTQQITALLEPAVILFMAVVVGALVMAIYSPMIALYDSIG